MRLYIILIWVTVVSSRAVSDTDYCADGSHSDGKGFTPSEGCYSYYYVCVNGKQQHMNCPSGTSYDVDKQECDFSQNIEECKSVTPVDCKDKDGNAVDSAPYTKSEDCDDGIYYVCIDGVETEESCPDDLIWDAKNNICNWPASVDCKSTSIKESSSTSSPTRTPSKKPLPDAHVTTTTKKPLPVSTTTTRRPATTTTTSSSTTTTTTAGLTDEYCSDDSHKDGDFFNPEEGCVSHYYQCVDGILIKYDCPPGTSFDKDLEQCVFPTSIEACNSAAVHDCRDEHGNVVSIPPYTKPEDCNGGVYYKCENGEEVEYQCAPGLVYDPDIQNCNHVENFTPCPTTTTEQTTTTAKEPDVPGTESSTKKPPTTTTTTPPTTTMTTTTTSTASTTTTTTAGLTDEDCSDGSHKNGEMFNPEEGCVSYYYQCVNGILYQLDCPPETAFNQTLGQCVSPTSIQACISTDDVHGCTDEHGNVVYVPPYTKPEDCSNGVYYKCENGEEISYQCAPGLVYDPEIQNCNYENVTPCPTTTSGPMTTTTERTTTSPKPTTTTREQTTASEENSEDATVESQTGIDVPVPESTTKKHSTTTTTTSTTTTTTTTPTTTTTSTAFTTTTGGYLSYVAFVVDDTGSMSNEIIAVKEWMTNCINGAYASCAGQPTGGWVVTSFNDPYVGDVTGPTTDVDEVIGAIDDLYAHGGGDCPEMAFGGIQSAVEVIPITNSGCKVFFFTDAIAKDGDLQPEVESLMTDKGCSFIPILTACCQPCSPPCNYTDPAYCINHIYDNTTHSTRKRRSTASSTSSQPGEALYYSLSEATGGNIYLTDKPSSPDDLLDFMEDEVTLGFCPSTNIAGPPPNGYECEADCVAMKMCWDRSVSKCYCNATCVHDPVYNSKCPGAPEVTCDPTIPKYTIADERSCKSYWQCSYGDKKHFECADGTIYSADTSSSYCDHPENVPPPCGTKTSTETPPETEHI